MSEQQVQTPQASDEQSSNPAAAANNPAVGGDNKSNEDSTPYRPDGLPDHLYGKSEKEIIDNLYKGYKGAREELSKSGKAIVPDKIDDYKIELPEELSKSVLRVGEDGKDPVFEGMRAVFHKNGIPADKALDVISEFYKMNAEISQKMNESVPAADFEFKALGGESAAKPMIDAVLAGLNGLKQTGKLTDDDVRELTYLTAYSEGLTGLKKLLQMTGEKTIPSNFETPQKPEITDSMLRERVADNRYRHGHPDFEQAFYDETMAMFKKLYS